MDENAILEKLNEVIKMNEKLMRENKEKDKKIKTLESSGSKFTVLIGSNSLMGVSLASPSGDVEIDVPFNETVSVSSTDLEQLLKSKIVRKQFVNGLLYFEDEENYDKFSVAHKYNINRDKIKDVMLTNNQSAIGNYFKEVHADGTDPSIRHSVFYQIAMLDNDGELRDMSFDTREYVERYFKMNLRNAAKLYEAVKGITV